MDSGQSAVVYRGYFKKKPIASDQPIAYSVRIDGRDLSVIANPSARSHVLVSGGFGGVASAKKEGLIKGAWSFTDFKGNAYKWDVKFSGSKWWLYDAVNQEVAFFERKPWRVEIEGFLFIRQRGHLQKFDINKSMIINSHPVSTRIDEFFIESSYAETFIQKMIDGKAASSIGIDPATTPFSDILNTTSPSSIVQLDQWNQQLAEMVIGMQQRLAELIANQHAKSALSPPQLTTSKAPAALDMDKAGIDISTAVPQCDCPSDIKYRVRRIYTVDCVKDRSISVKRHLQKYGITSSMIIYSHPINDRFDEFIVESTYADTFVHALYDAHAVAVIGYNLSGVVSQAISLGAPVPTYSQYCRSLVSAYKIARGTKQFRSKEFLQEYAAEIGIRLL
ncbi:hypothetical protein DL89DRAFT_295340 [Linderina pennispora]|uniref:Uncharacterized protein n=1 Tax=Linderina pennispora TaxID=61395 RepID=A0A1Y1VYX0_9FUNG|nr:uncharacterized protein DL89DRAFT_295340 [Linderina pennispora]ORX66453.1 hypothetical protein DL89DRAFT_295340 [Linderina pennispora]